MNQRELFLRHLAQTSDEPVALEITKAQGCNLYTSDGKTWIDAIGGISVANTGHGHPKVLEAIKAQLDDYLHVMVYGECIQSPQVKYASALVASLPENLNSVYFTNSCSEAVEGAMKLAKRATGRWKMVAFKNGYHGSTQGALSIIGDEYRRNAFRPLLPGIRHEVFGDFESLKAIDEETACVIVETVQGEAGVIAPSREWMFALRNRCNETGALLVLDEIQAGFRRTGDLWAFTAYNIIPDILLLGKALGGGLPLGAFISDRSVMWLLTEDPVLGHITTFGGHPLSCAAGLAAFELICEMPMQSIKEKEALFLQLLVHPGIRQVRSAGLWLAIQLSSAEECQKVIRSCMQKGLFIDWFLFAPDCLRISPPLIITETQIRQVADIILNSLN